MFADAMWNFDPLMRDINTQMSLYSNSSLYGIFVYVFFSFSILYTSNYYHLHVLFKCSVHMGTIVYNICYWIDDKLNLH